MTWLLSLVNSGAVDTVMIAKLDRLIRTVKNLAELSERFTRHGVSLVSVAESMDTETAAGRLVPNITTALFQWGPEAFGERTRGTPCTTSGRLVSGWGRSASAITWP